MCNDGHVADVMLHVHDTTEFFGCELHHLDWFQKSDNPQNDPVNAQMTEQVPGHSELYNNREKKIKKQCKVQLMKDSNLLINYNS